VSKLDLIDMGTTSAVPAASIARRRAMLLDEVAPVVLSLSIAAGLASPRLVPNRTDMMDLHVYIRGAAAIEHPGMLYSYVNPDFQLLPTDRHTVRVEFHQKRPQRPP
jgi:alpha-1,2-mannosyltransferase